MIKGRKIRLLVLFCIVLIVFLYRYSPRRIEFFGHYDKVYAHRVNSLDKLEASLKYFDGIELDLDYNSSTNVLDVNHPPAQSINLDFKTYLSKIPENEYPFLWLDIKELDTSNAHAIQLKLNTLFNERNYPKKQILIETLYPEVLPIFNKSGYNTSYYLPGKLAGMNAKELDSTLSKIKTILLKQPELGISTNHKDYGIISKAFPKRTKYIWALSSPFNPDYKSVRTIVKDKTVSVVLSAFKAFSGNR